MFHWCQKTRYLCDWSVAKADRLNHHHVELHLRLCGQDYLAGQNDLRIIIMIIMNTLMRNGPYVTKSSSKSCLNEHLQTCG